MIKLRLALDLHAMPPNLNGLRIELVRALPAIMEAFAALDYEAIITSGTEGQHQTRMHPEGRALDFRLKHVSPEHRVPIRDAIRTSLGPDFLVGIEEPPVAPLHLHVGLLARAPAAA